MSIWSRLQRQIGEIANDLLADETHVELERARDLLQTNPAQAASIATAVLKNEPENALAMAIVATARLEEGQAEIAAGFFDRALEIDGDLPEALLGRGEAALASQQPQDGLASYHRAIEVAGGEGRILAEAYRGLGFCFRRLGKLDKAVRELRKAVAEDSGDALGRAALGDALVAAGHRDEARRHLRRAMSRPTPPTLALVTLGHLAIEEGDGARAEGLLQSALHSHRGQAAFEPTEAEIYLALGDASRASGVSASALQHYEKALTAGGSRQRLFARIGEVHRQSGNREAALDYFLRSLEIEESQEILEHAIEVALAVSATETSVDLANRLLSIIPNHPRALAARALAMVEGGDASSALTLLEAASPREPSVHIVRSRIAIAGGDLDGAADHALAALRMSPLDEEARRLLSDIRSRQLIGPLSTSTTLGDEDQASAPADLETAWHTLAGQVARVLAGRPELGALVPRAASAASDFERPLLVTVMGEFSSGKSSFVNAFIGEEIAPTGITPTTATINVVKYGRERGGRILYRDGRAESVVWNRLFARLSELNRDQARDVAHVEILLPLEALERVHLVDTPGLNSILPEHEDVARDFIARADAVVWLFAAGQAGKKTERRALETIRQQGTRILGVLNKVDQLPSEEQAAVIAHLSRELDGLVDEIVPVSARLAMNDRRDGAANEAFENLENELESRFFARARELKRIALDRRLRIVLNDAADALARSRQSDDAEATALHRAADRMRDEGARFESEIAAAERARIRDDIESLYRSAASEVLELVRPRRLPFGSHQASPADRDYLIGLLSAGYDQLVAASRQRILAELTAIGDKAIAELPTQSNTTAAAIDDIQRSMSEARRWVSAHVFERTSAFVAGYLRGGYVREFFQRDLPKLPLQPEKIFDALYHSSPDLDSVIAIPLQSASSSVLDQLRHQLRTLADRAALHGFDLDVGAARALELLDERRAFLASAHGQQHPRGDAGN